MKQVVSFFKSRSIDELLMGVLVFFLPFERIPSTDVFGVSLRLSFIVAAILIARALLALVKTRLLILRRDRPVQLLLGFSTWIFLTISVSLNTTRAIQVAIFTLFTILTAVSIRILYKPGYLPTLIRALLASAFLVAIFGLYQYFGDMAGLANSVTGLRGMYGWQVFGFPRIHSTTLEPLYYCSYLLIPISYLLVELLSRQEKNWKCSSLFVLLLSSLVLTLSRGGIVAFVSLFIVVVIMLKIRSRISLRKFLITLGLIAISIAASMIVITFVSREPLNKDITLGQRGTAGYGNQLKKTSLDGSGDDRGLMRSEAIRLYSSGGGTRIIVGIGAGQFGPYLQDNKISEAGGWKIVNNEPLELVLEYGLVGVLLLGSFLLTVLLRAWKATKTNNDMASVVSVALLGYIFATLVQYQTFSTLYIMHIWVVVGLLMALSSRPLKVKGA